MQKIKGNLINLALEGEFDVIVHGCNCQNTMGSGIAREIKRRIPQAYAADTEAFKSGIVQLGFYSQAEVRNHYFDPFVVINAYTQYHYLPRNKDHFDYVGFKDILNNLADEFGGRNYGFPYIGMGLAGGNKDKIMTLLEEFSLEIEYMSGTVTLVEFEG